MDERKWEFGGENMRWKDLVRNNKYSEVIYYSFLRYYCVGEAAGGTSDYMELVEEYDGMPNYLENLPYNLFYRISDNPNDINIYPNRSMDILDIYNPYQSVISAPSGENWQTSDFYSWWNDSEGSPTDQCLFSFYGFIRGDRRGNILQVDGSGKVSTSTGALNLPVVRYILPYPNAAIQRSAGEYKNYYGYVN